MDKARIAASLGVATPIICILTSIALSPWFSIYNNALSDLGHVIRSNVAPIFNYGLSTGGFLIGLSSVLARGLGRFMKASILATGYSLMLVGVFDESYNRFHDLHFKVSVLFFTMLIVMLLAYAIEFKTIKSIPVAAALVIMWLLYFKHHLTPGAAVPESLSIALAVPFYLKAIFSTRASSF